MNIDDFKNDLEKYVIRIYREIFLLPYFLCNEELENDYKMFLSKLGYIISLVKVFLNSAQLYETEYEEFKKI